MNLNSLIIITTVLTFSLSSLAQTKYLLSDQIEDISININNFRDVVIGETNHESSHGPDFLVEVLRNDAISLNPNFDTIYLESFAKFDSLFRKLSFKELSLEQIRSELSVKDFEDLLCLNSEWYYHVLKLLPLIRNINQKRDQLMLRPIVVLPVDSANDEPFITFKYSSPKYLFRSTDPRLHERFMSFYVDLHSGERELETASYIEKLRQNRGVGIFFYHQGHIFKNGQMFIPDINHDKKEVVFDITNNWLQNLIELDPSFNPYTIALDQDPFVQDVYGNIEPSSFDSDLNWENPTMSNLSPILNNGLSPFDSIFSLGDKDFVLYDKYWPIKKEVEVYCQRK